MLEKFWHVPLLLFGPFWYFGNHTSELLGQAPGVSNKIYIISQKCMPLWFPPICKPTFYPTWTFSSSSPSCDTPPHPAPASTYRPGPEYCWHLTFLSEAVIVLPWGYQSINGGGGQTASCEAPSVGGIITGSPGNVRPFLSGNLKDLLLSTGRIQENPRIRNSQSHPSNGFEDLLKDLTLTQGPLTSVCLVSFPDPIVLWSDGSDFWHSVSCGCRIKCPPMLVGCSRLQIMS